MAQNDWPKVMYHTAIRHRRNVFGQIVPGFAYDGDLVDPNYPKPEGHQRDTDIQSKGRVMGPHLLEQKHYRTCLVAVYDSAGGFNEPASIAEVERLKKEGWVTDPNELKEEYED